VQQTGKQFAGEPSKETTSSASAEWATTGRTKRITTTTACTAWRRTAPRFSWPAPRTTPQSWCSRTTTQQPTTTWPRYTTTLRTTGQPRFTTTLRPRSLLDAPRSPLAQIIEFRVHFTHSTTGDPLLSSFPRRETQQRRAVLPRTQHSLRRCGCALFNKSRLNRHRRETCLGMSPRAVDNGYVECCQEAFYHEPFPRCPAAHPAAPLQPVVLFSGLRYAPPSLSSSRLRRRRSRGPRAQSHARGLASRSRLVS
jgi:hypothetical protein